MGLLLILGKNRPRLGLILPVVAALLVSIFIFWGIKQGLIVGSIAVLIPALAYFLPGATFTTGMFELASGKYNLRLKQSYLWGGSSISASFWSFNGNADNRLASRRSYSHCPIQTYVKGGYPSLGSWFLPLECIFSCPYVIETCRGYCWFFT